ncbi:MAG TPA: OmpA family protein [Spirochaetota bacterium]|nr:OmpA family protein [Spirochaetota bacterium]HPJ35696.1 OmpA family protein [Spirochaetota bacterium]
MKKKNIITLTAVLVLSAGAVLKADVFYTNKEYRTVYNEKVALEIELKTLNQQYSNEKSNLNKKIRELEIEVESLKKEIENLKNRNASDKEECTSRIDELQKMIELLKSKSSETEKDLIETNRLLQKKCDEEREKLRKECDSEREKLLDEINSLKKNYEDKINSLNSQIENLNSEIADLKKLNEKQRAELARMESQAQELEKQLEEEIRNGNIRLKKSRNRLIINIDDRISFDSGRANLKKQVLPALRKIRDILAQYPEYNIIVEGHTDDIPIRTSRFRNNWQLSTERALAVLGYILKNKELKPERFSATGCGQYRPVVPNNSKENRALNRRVDIIVVPSFMIQ